MDNLKKKYFNNESYASIQTSSVAFQAVDSPKIQAAAPPQSQTVAPPQIQAAAPHQNHQTCYFPQFARPQFNLLLLSQEDKFFYMELLNALSLFFELEKSKFEQTHKKAKQLFKALQMHSLYKIFIAKENLENYDLSNKNFKKIQICEQNYSTLFENCANDLLQLKSKIYMTQIDESEFQQVKTKYIKFCSALEQKQLKKK